MTHHLQQGAAGKAPRKKYVPEHIQASGERGGEGENTYVGDSKGALRQALVLVQAAHSLAWAW